MVAALGDSSRRATALGTPIRTCARRSPIPMSAASTATGPSERCPAPTFATWCARERTDEIEARLESCAEGADVLVVQGGVNDIAQGLAVETSARNLRDMVRAGKRLGLRVAIVEPCPGTAAIPAPRRRFAC